ncbi:bacteriocin maturation protein [Cohnella endophytica]|uniref:Bacteriocin maturation protein n=1 Tax=Cohnella endophytica TaxID=2419778 RepID=A0A494Y738_9BACL|nr:bacteriocin maturation protein [Cohnella endophytica]RKP58114.1 bacteriocin maturation protein [Cohnella endophytica]
MIEFQNSTVGAKVLAIGDGTMLSALVKALFESGLKEVHEMSTNSESSNANFIDWSDKIRLFDWILYVNQRMNLEDIHTIHNACGEESKPLLIATCLGQTGFMVPSVYPNSGGGWESAWRRIHRSAIEDDPMLPTMSFSAEAMLINVLVFELNRAITSESSAESGWTPQLYRMNLQTLEGAYHTYMPHPLVTKGFGIELIPDWNQRLGREHNIRFDPERFLSFIGQLTSPYFGILHLWEEGNLKQLPLSQCRVQPIDPLSEGPVELLPAVISSGLTHREARKLAGLAGIEAHAARLGHGHVDFPDSAEVGAGQSIEETVFRGLEKCLTQQLRKRTLDRIPIVQAVQITRVEDDRCRYYLQALTTMQGAPSIGSGEDLFGLPVVWVGAGERWHGCVGLNRTLALRSALTLALMMAQNPTELPMPQGIHVETVDLLEGDPTRMTIDAIDDTAQAEQIQLALQVLNRNRKSVSVYKLSIEPFVNEHLGGLFGIRLGEAGTTN